MSTDERKGRPSASGIERIALCPGSWSAEQSVTTPEASSDAAEFGTRVHAVLAYEAGEDTLTADEVDCVNACRNLLEALLKEHDFDPNAADSVRFEERFWNSEETVSGKPDVIIIQGSRALIVDYKTGRGDVTIAAGNAQLMTLAVILSENFPHVTHITAAIVQPYAVPNVSVVGYGTAELHAAADQLGQWLDVSGMEHPPLVPGTKQCRYCRARATCPALRNVALDFSDTTGGETGITPKSKAKIIFNVAQLDAPTLRDALDRCELAGIVIDALKAEARTRLEQDADAVPGYTLKPGRKLETIIDAQTVFARAVEKGIQPHDFMTAVKIQKGALKTALKNATGDKGKALDASLADCLTDCLETTVSKPTLAKVKNS